MPENLTEWTAALTAFAGLLAALWKLRAEYLAWRATGDRAALTEHLRKLAPLAVVAIERIAASTPTKKDDEALAWVRRGLAAAGYPLPENMEQHARELLHAEYQRYKAELGIPAHMDGAAAKKLLEIVPDAGPQSGN